MGYAIDNPERRLLLGAAIAGMLAAAPASAKAGQRAPAEIETSPKSAMDGAPDFTPTPTGYRGGRALGLVCRCWPAALAGHANDGSFPSRPNSQPHHQPLNYFEQFAPGGPRGPSICATRVKARRRAPTFASPTRRAVRRQAT